VYADLMRLSDQNKLNSLERPKQFKLLFDPFTVESDILTPTMKMKRNIAKKMFEKDIQELYSLPPISKKK